MKTLTAEEVLKKYFPFDKEDMWVGEALAAMEEYHNQFTQREPSEAEEIVQDLAEWSKRYPKDSVYNRSEPNVMDRELYALEDRAKQWHQSHPRNESKPLAKEFKCSICGVLTEETKNKHTACPSCINQAIEIMRTYGTIEGEIKHESTELEILQGELIEFYEKNIDYHALASLNRMDIDKLKSRIAELKNKDK